MSLHPDRRPVFVPGSGQMRLNATSDDYLDLAAEIESLAPSVQNPEAALHHANTLLVKATRLEASSLPKSGEVYVAP